MKTLPFAITIHAPSQWVWDTMLQPSGDVDGGTERRVDMDCADPYGAMFQAMWPRSLRLLKALSEKFHADNLSS